MSIGKVFLVGAGPGDPGLITVRGKQLIDIADAIVYDALANRDLLPPGAKETGSPELYFVGKRGGDERSVSQDQINDTLIRLAREGKRVVRLKGVSIGHAKAVAALVPHGPQTPVYGMSRSIALK